MPVDALDPTWIDAPGGVGPTYNSEELRRDLGFLLAGGATPDVSRTGVLDTRALTVSLSGSNVQINPGGCAVGTGKGAYLTGASATVTVDALVAADVTNPRRDRVVLEILDPDNGGGAGRRAQFRVITGTPSATAASGGGYPAAPSSPSITLAYVDVPKSGSGSPSVTDQRPYTAAAGATIPVASKAERDSLPKWPGASVVRLDRGGSVDYCNGTAWSSAIEAVPFTLETGYSFTGSLMRISDGVSSVARLVGKITRSSGGSGPALNAINWTSVMTTQFMPAGMRPLAGSPTDSVVNMATGVDGSGNPVITAQPIITIKPDGSLWARLPSGSYTWPLNGYITVDVSWPL